MQYLFYIAYKKSKYHKTGFYLRGAVRVQYSCVQNALKHRENDAVKPRYIILYYIILYCTLVRHMEIYWR